MNQLELDMMKGMVSILNEASEAYYNTGNPIMSDEQFDKRLEDLRQFEEETGFILANSPTQNVGAKVLTELKEIEHNHPMLSLEKCHTIEELIKFANNKPLVASIKLDGLTVSIKYENGLLVSAETRGNGYVGSDITEHIKQFSNVPMKINKEGIYIVDGEAIITDEDFAEVNKDGEYKNSRNLASGTLSVLDTSLVAKRRLKFFVWDVIEGGCNDIFENLYNAEELGFDTVPNWSATNLNPKKIQGFIDYVFDYAQEEGLPNDGIVFKFRDIEYGKSLGATSHHFKNGIAYKRKDEVYKTELLDIEWTMGKTGILTPTAIFKAVEIDGTTVERASVHNISILTKLDLHIGDTIEVYKANMIIPQVKRNISADERMSLNKETDYIIIPSTCPICGGETRIKQDNDTKVLVCTNDNCKGKLLGKLTHFVSKNAMDIDGMSEATLEKFIELGWLNSFKDIFTLKDHFTEMVKLDGFGETSVKKLLNSIEESRNTTLDKFLVALSIPNIGKSNAKLMTKKFGSIDFFKNHIYYKYLLYFTDDDNDEYEAYEEFGVDWTTVNGFDEKTHRAINRYIRKNAKDILELLKELKIEVSEKKNNDIDLTGKTFVITGSLTHYKNRDELVGVIESMGGKVSGSVSAKTSYLINNDVNSTSGKNKKAKELGVPIIAEQDFIDMINK